MTRFDLSPLYSTTVGFDRFNELLDKAFSPDFAPATYPPFNIEKTSASTYRISIAAAGFSESDLRVEVRENQLHVTAQKGAEAKSTQYLHKGIAQRSFRKQFALADHMIVTGASYENGMLHVELKREIPDALKPRTIQIATNGAAQVEQAKDGPKLVA